MNLFNLHSKEKQFQHCNKKTIHAIDIGSAASLSNSKNYVRAFSPLMSYFIIHRHPENPDGLKPVRVFRADFLPLKLQLSGF
jgi:hypothetical protein